MSARTSRTVSTLPSSDTPRDLVLLEGADGALVAVLGAQEVPEAEDQRQHDRQRRVVHGAPDELGVVPRHAGRRVREVEGVDDEHDERDGERVDYLVATPQVPRAGL